MAEHDFRWFVHGNGQQPKALTINGHDMAGISRDQIQGLVEDFFARSDLAANVTFIHVLRHCDLQTTGANAPIINCLGISKCLAKVLYMGPVRFLRGDPNRRKWIGESFSRN